MKTNNYNSFELETNARLKDISGISFTPVEKIKINKVVNKGEWIFWKFLGIIPIFPYKAKNDLYESEEWGSFYGKVTIKRGLEIVNNYIEKAFINNEELFLLAKVVVRHISLGSEIHRFKSNEEAMKFIDELKIKCKTAGNELI